MLDLVEAADQEQAPDLKIPSRDQLVHRNPATLVTLTIRYPGAKFNQLTTTS
jgi:hypothetical protein